MAKIKRHECKSLKEFNKIIRKYIKYFRNRYIYDTYWYTWIWIDVIGKDEIKSLSSYIEKRINLRCIVDTILNNYDWSFEYKNGKIYYLRGVEISNEDYYYIYVAEDGDKIYSSCVGRFDEVKHIYGK